MAGILDGIRVIEWGSRHVGPNAATMLGQMGADVIKLEDPRGGDPYRGLRSALGIAVATAGGRNYLFEEVNLNKRSITVDLRKPEGREVVYRLMAKSDVFLTNYRRSAAIRMGVDYESLKVHNPRLIYAIASAYGFQGPDAGDTGNDGVAQARAGTMMALREPEEDPFSIPGIGDQMGAIALSYGVVGALLARERYGVGQEIRTSILGCLLWLQNLALGLTLMAGQEPKREDRSKALNPLLSFYRAGDSKWMRVGLAVETDKWWPRFCRAVGIEELEQDPRFANLDVREKNREEFIAILDRVFQKHSREEWLKIFKEWDLTVAPVNAYADVINDPQVWANRYIVEHDHPVLGQTKYVNFPIEFGQTPVSIRSVAPELGQHTEEVLLEVGGYTWEDIEQLRAKGAL